MNAPFADGRVAHWRARCILPLAPLALATACARRPHDEIGRAETTSIVIAVDAGAAPAAADHDPEDDATLERDLRDALAADDTLSPRAREIEVLVVAGRATLRGRVGSPREHDDVIAKARRLGAHEVVDELRVSGTRRHASPAAPAP